MIVLAQRVKGGYKNRITTERSKNEKLEGELSLHQEWSKAINTDTSYLNSLIVAVILSLIFIPIFVGIDFKSVFITSIFIFVVWCLQRLYKTAKIRVRLNEMENNKNRRK